MPKLLKPRVDRVIVSSRIFALDIELNSTKLDALGYPWGIRDDGVTFFKLGTFSVDAADATERQARFAEVINRFREDAIALSVDLGPKSIARAEVDVSLVRASGQAGIVLTQTELTGWGDLELAVFVDSL